ncbi:MAG: hypothetical protein QNJ65_06320 [Xenococcaceae cyanobacterium MO_234.B1]|nr:hypothetical protein [Xenococcaceae cyanobacterium MO_234.B1]
MIRDISVTSILVWNGARYLGVGYQLVTKFGSYLLPLLLPSAETTKAMLPALIEVVTNALRSLIPDTRANATAVPTTVANQVFRSDLLS